MNFLAIDVHYKKNTGFAAALAFSDLNDSSSVYKSTIETVEDYVSGEFYKRERPCIQAVLDEHNLSPDCIIVDGYVHLEQGKPGLGKYLYDSLNGNAAVIGVAKNPRGLEKKYEVFRGTSSRPLFVTSEGIDLEQAKNIVQHLQGVNRIPDHLKRVDSLCREE